MTLSQALRFPAYRAALTNGFANGWALFGVRSALVPLFVVEGLQVGSAMDGHRPAVLGARRGPGPAARRPAVRLARPAAAAARRRRRPDDQRGDPVVGGCDPALPRRAWPSTARARRCSASPRRPWWVTSSAAGAGVPWRRTRCLRTPARSSARWSAVRSRTPSASGSPSSSRRPCRQWRSRRPLRMPETRVVHPAPTGRHARPGRRPRTPVEPGPLAAE